MTKVLDSRDISARQTRAERRRAATPMSDLPAVRLFTACEVTHLMVIEHLRRHLPAPAAHDYLLWHPAENEPAIDQFMRAVISNAGFSDSLDMRAFKSIRPRTHGAVQWLIESPRRLRADATALREWMRRNDIVEAITEVWAADPFHFNVVLPRGMLRNAKHVKIPHCFNLEDAMTPYLKARFESNWRSTSWIKQHIYYPWLLLASGMDMRLDRLAYDRAYTFAMPSPWSKCSIDLSPMISLKAFSATYDGLPAPMRAEVEAELAPIRTGSRPIVLLLLFGLGEGDDFRRIYQQAMARIFNEHAAKLVGCVLAVKPHPNAKGAQEKLLLEWLKANVPAQIHEIRHRLNLEFMLPQLRPDYVMAGLCGSLPIVRDLRAGRPIVIREWLELYRGERAGEREGVSEFLRGIEVW